MVVGGRDLSWFGDFFLPMEEFSSTSYFISISYPPFILLHCTFLSFSVSYPIDFVVYSSLYVSHPIFPVSYLSSLYPYLFSLFSILLPSLFSIKSFPFSNLFGSYSIFYVSNLSFLMYVPQVWCKSPFDPLTHTMSLLCTLAMLQGHLLHPNRARMLEILDNDPPSKHVIFGTLIKSTDPIPPFPWSTSPPKGTAPRSPLCTCSQCCPPCRPRRRYKILWNGVQM